MLLISVVLLILVCIHGALSKGKGGQCLSKHNLTPNPASLMFHPGKSVMEVESADFSNARTAMNLPLARSLFAIDGVTRVFFGSDFVSVTKSDDISWDILKPEIFAAIMDFYTSGQSLFLDESTAALKDTTIHEDDSETVAMIKELLETRIRPAVQDLIWKMELSNYSCKEHGVAVLVHLSL